MPPHLAVESEEIDMLVYNLMDTAEEQYRKLHTSSHARSPSYRQMGLVSEYWYMKKGYILNTRNFRQLIVLQNKLGIKYDKNLTKEQVGFHLKLAHR